MNNCLPWLLLLQTSHTESSGRTLPLEADGRWQHIQESKRKVHVTQESWSSVPLLSQPLGSCVWSPNPGKRFPVRRQSVRSLRISRCHTLDAYVSDHSCLYPMYTHTSPHTHKHTTKNKNILPSSCIYHLSLSGESAKHPWISSLEKHMNLSSKTQEIQHAFIKDKHPTQKNNLNSYGILFCGF